MLLLIDNYDSFTYNLADYLLQCGAKLEVIRNDKLELSALTGYSGIVLSPGPGKPESTVNMMEVISACASTKPILGVCLGMQALGLHFGSQLIKAKKPMHGKVSSLTYDAQHPMFHGVTNPLEVCRYHSLILDDTPLNNVRIIARSVHGEPMALAHNDLPLWGVQFHPEAILSTQGKLLIRNWLINADLL